MKRTVPLLFLVSAALAITACGDSGKTLDTTQVEKDIQGITTDAGVKATAKCPDEVKDIKKGTTYECTITYSGNENNKQTVQMKVGDNDESEFADQEKVSSEVAIRGIVAQSDEDPATACEHLSADLLEQLGGEEDCPAQATEGDDGKPTVIKSLDVQGGTATMVTDESTTTFEKDEQGSWVATSIE
jgi:hypothetical protein